MLRSFMGSTIRSTRNGRFAAALLVPALLLATAPRPARADIVVTNKISDVRGTKHNFSAVADGSATPSGGKVPARAVKASSETQVCVFCHTPHEAESVRLGPDSTAPGAPLWNRKVSGQTYTPYVSISIDADVAELAAGPGGSSKLCLSCHDGTMAIDKVNALNGVKDATIPMSGIASPVRMPAGAATTGFTRDLGTDLSSDHPISFTYSAAVAGLDGELRAPDGTLVGNRAIGAARPKLPLENGQMQCVTCHDPHLRDAAAGNGNAKFLRMNRFQVTQPVGGAFSAANDIICLACHDKAGASWAYSAHANSQVATQLYTPAAAAQREFPSSLDVPANTNPPVWQVGCLNCHDTHTVQGARRLLREGTDSPATPKAGGGAALEETCYQCHASSASSAVTYAAGTVNAIPDIKTDFALARHMPIKSSQQAAGTEVHDVGGVFNDNIDANCGKLVGKCGKDLLEPRAKLGFGTPNNRHAECSDCHNPHRVVKFRDFRGNPAGSITGPPDAAGTHAHTDDSAAIHLNIASGVLRGSWGVEPSYGSASFQALPSDFSVKRGDPGNNAGALASAPYVTREYQICLKCHSNYGYTDDNLYPSGLTRPELGVGETSGLTPQNSNGHLNFTRYTNQAKEFQAPATHAVPVGSVSLGFDGGAGSSAAVAATNSNNHRSWHPVMAPTGRLGRAGAWLAPWNNSGTGGRAGRLGVQTMYCSDCHGSNTATGSAIPAGGDNGAPWGPHGSTNNFLLKGTWNTGSGEGDSNTLCFKCHSESAYSGGGGTGFQTTDKGDGHAVHSDRIDTAMKCNFCHVAVPHGWKNRGLLVNLRDVGSEAGLAPGTDVGNGPYTNGPYYRRAYLRINSFPSGGTWSESNCGGRDAMKNQCETAN